MRKSNYSNTWTDRGFLTPPEEIVRILDEKIERLEKELVGLKSGPKFHSKKFDLESSIRLRDFEKNKMDRLSATD